MPNKTRAVPLLASLLAAVLGLGACSTDDRRSDDGRPVVLTTFTVLADIAQNVAGDRLDVQSITRPGAEIHGYEPTPADIRKAATADLVVDNGLGLEAWFEQFVADLDVPHLVASDGIDPIDITSDEYAGKPNPHAWMSPVNVERYADNLARRFSDLDPDGAADYRANADSYKAELREVHTGLLTALDALPENQRALVTCEGAFSYLARDAGLQERYIWPVNAEQQATPQRVAATVDFVEKAKVPAVFCESTVSDQPMRQVAEASGSRYGGTLYVDSLSESDGPVPTYLDLIRHDATTIAEGLTGKAS